MHHPAGLTHNCSDGVPGEASAHSQASQYRQNLDAKDEGQHKADVNGLVQEMGCWYQDMRVTVGTQTGLASAGYSPHGTCKAGASHLCLAGGREADRGSCRQWKNAAV